MEITIEIIGLIIAFLMMFGALAGWILSIVIKSAKREEAQDRRLKALEDQSGVCTQAVACYPRLDRVESDVQKLSESLSKQSHYAIETEKFVARIDAKLELLVAGYHAEPEKNQKWGSMILQDARELKGTRYNFKDFACKWFSILFWYEQLLHRSVTRGFIKTWTEKIVTRDLMSANLLIPLGEELPVCEALEMPVDEVKEEGSDYICAWNELEILWLWKRTSRGEYDHFVPGDGQGNHVWDSLGIRPGRDDYQVKGKRVLVLNEAWCRQHWRNP